MAEVHPSDPHPPNGAGDGSTQPETIGRKRQRRPSVRLGDIGGDQTLLYDSAGAGAHPRRGRGNQSQNLSSRAGTLGEEKEVNLDTIRSWKVRGMKRQVAALPAAAKRPRSNWAKDSKFEDSNGFEDDVAAAAEEEEEDGYSGRGFNAEDSESPIEDGKGGGLSGPWDDDVREYGNDNVGCSGREDAVRIWLNSIGLGRYAPVFEVHEVDDEVLPMLTLEDLKDMGISAVGSRRKMFCAIQKLGRGFS